MSKKLSSPETTLSEVIVNEDRKKHHSYQDKVRKAPKMNNSDFVYVNPAFVGSMNSVDQRIQPEPPTDVIREQYWACSRWPYTQRVLAATVGVLVGAVIGLAITMIMKNTDDNIIGGIFRSSAPD